MNLNIGTHPLNPFLFICIYIFGKKIPGAISFLEPYFDEALLQTYLPEKSGDSGDGGQIRSKASSKVD